MAASRRRCDSHEGRWTSPHDDVAQSRSEDSDTRARKDGQTVGSDTLARRQHGDESQENSGKRCGDRGHDDERREGERVHAGHGGSAVREVHDGVVHRTGAGLTGHAVCVGTHVGLTRERGEEQMAAHLSESAQGDERPQRRTKLHGRSEHKS